MPKEIKKVKKVRYSKSCKNDKNINKKNTTSSNSKSINNNYIELGLDKLSYADYVLLASLVAYSIGEELNDSDLDLLIVFFSMISSDLALVRTKRGVLQRQQAANVAIDTTISDVNESIVSDLSRKTKIKKKKYIKKNSN